MTPASPDADPSDGPRSGGPAVGAPTEHRTVRVPVPDRPDRPDGPMLWLEVDHWGPAVADADVAPLVLVHGFTGCRGNWAEVAPVLAADRPVLALDLRGHGTSDRAADPGTYTIEVLVQDLDAVLTTVAPGPIDLLGHSMGGVAAQQWAVAYPDRLRSLVLMDTAGTSQGGMPLDLVEAMAERGQEDGMEAVVAVVRAAFVDDDEAGAVDGWAGQGLVAVDPAALVPFARALQTHPPLFDELAALRCPTTVLVGADDALRDAADALHAAMPGSHLEVVPDAGHSPQLENRDAWLAALAGHLARADADRPSTPQEDR